MLLFGMHKAGIVDVRAMIRSAVGINDGVRDINADSRNVMQVLLSKVEELAQYANHDTTENIQRVESGVAQLSDKFDAHVREHDRLQFMIQDIRDNGIKCR